MKNIFTIFILFCLCLTAGHAQDFETDTDGLITSGTSWLGGTSPFPSNSTYLADKEVHIGDSVYYTGDFRVQGGHPSSLIIRVLNGGYLKIDGNFTAPNTELIIEEGGTVDITGQYSGDGQPSPLTLNGNLKAGSIFKSGSGGTNVWTIGSTGNLKVSGSFDVESNGFILNNAGKISVGGNFETANTFGLNNTGAIKLLGTTVVFQNGTDIDNNGSISIPNITTLTDNGSNFDCDGSTGNGYVSFGSLPGFCSYCDDGGTPDSDSTGCFSNNDSTDPLPIDLVFFTAELENNEFQFAWQTASEENNDYFTIEYSEDILSFTQLDNIVGAGNSSSIIDYEYSAPAFPFEEVIYFRLKQTDYDGTFAYSKIVPVIATGTVDFGIYPNPASNSSLLSLNNFDEKETYTAKIINSLTMHSEGTYDVVNGQAVINVTNLENGMYYIMVSGYSNPFKLLVQH